MHRLYTQAKVNIFTTLEFDSNLSYKVSGGIFHSWCHHVSAPKIQILEHFVFSNQGCLACDNMQMFRTYSRLIKSPGLINQIYPWYILTAFVVYSEPVISELLCAKCEVLFPSTNDIHLSTQSRYIFLYFLKIEIFNMFIDILSKIFLIGHISFCIDFFCNNSSYLSLFLRSFVYLRCREAESSSSCWLLPNACPSQHQARLKPGAVISIWSSHVGCVTQALGPIICCLPAVSGSRIGSKIA